MTTIVLATDLPSNVNTLERLIYHNALAFRETIGNSTFNLDATTNPQQPYITITQGYANTGDKQLYASIFCYLPLDTRIATNELNQRPWMYAKEASNNAYPIAYRAT